MKNALIGLAAILGLAGTPAIVDQAIAQDLVFAPAVGSNWVTTSKLAAYHSPIYGGDIVIGEIPKGVTVKVVSTGTGVDGRLMLEVEYEGKVWTVFP